LNRGGPHGAPAASADVNGGKMDGFIRQEQLGGTCLQPDQPGCSIGGGERDVMGWHDAREIPNYWQYAQQFTLQDHMFEPNASWSLPSHLFMVSEWSAHCTEQGDPSSCVNALQNPGNPPDFQLITRRASTAPTPPDYAWTDLTYLLYQQNV